MSESEGERETRERELDRAKARTIENESEKMCALSHVCFLDSLSRVCIYIMHIGCSSNLPCSERQAPRPEVAKNVSSRKSKQKSHLYYSARPHDGTLGCKECQHLIDR